MKKLLFGLAAIGLLATASCKKDSDDGPSNRITVAGDALGVTSFTVQGSFVSITGGGTASNASGILLNFSGTTEPANGTYKIVENATNANEVDLTANRVSAPTKLFNSTNTSTNLTVGRDGGKITISMPDVQLKLDGGTETLTVSANATQL